MSWLFASGGQSVRASASILPRVFTVDFLESSNARDVTDVFKGLKDFQTSYHLDE